MPPSSCADLITAMQSLLGRCPASVPSFESFLQQVLKFHSSHFKLPFLFCLKSPYFGFYKAGCNQQPKNTSKIY